MHEEIEKKIPGVIINYVKTTDENEDGELLEQSIYYDIASFPSLMASLAKNRDKLIIPFEILVAYSERRYQMTGKHPFIEQIRLKSGESILIDLQVTKSELREICAYYFNVSNILPEVREKWLAYQNGELDQNLLPKRDHTGRIISKIFADPTMQSRNILVDTDKNKPYPHARENISERLRQQEEKDSLNKSIQSGINDVYETIRTNEIDERTDSYFHDFIQDSFKTYCTRVSCSQQVVTEFLNPEPSDYLVFKSALYSAFDYLATNGMPVADMPSWRLVAFRAGLIGFTLFQNTSHSFHSLPEEWVSSFQSMRDTYSAFQKNGILSWPPFKKAVMSASVKLLQKSEE